MPDQPLRIGPLRWAVVDPFGEVVAVCRTWATALEVLDNRPAVSGWRIVELKRASAG